MSDETIDSLGGTDAIRLVERNIDLEFACERAVSLAIGACDENSEPITEVNLTMGTLAFPTTVMFMATPSRFKAFPIYLSTV